MTATALRTPLVFTGLHLVFFWRVVAGQFFCWGDALIAFWPWRHFTRELMLSGRLPLWNPYNFCGVPFAANPQTGVFYPPNLLSLPLPAHAWPTWSAVLHVWLAGLGMISLVRVHGGSSAAQLLGACAYALSGCVIARLQFVNHMVAFAALPWLLWCFEVTRAHSGRRLVGVAGISALMWMGGHPQLNLIVLTTVLVFVAFDRPSGRDGALLVSALLFGCGLASIQLLPALELMLNSSRGELTDLQQRLFAVPPWQMIVWLLPDFYGNPARSAYWGEGNFFEASPYVGATTLVLIALGARECRHRLKARLLVLLVMGVLLMMGYYAPFYPLVANAFPPLGMFRAAGRWMLPAVFALSLLAALVLDEVVDDVRRVRRGSVLAGALATVLMMLGIGMTFGSEALAGVLLPALRAVLDLTGKQGAPVPLIAQAGLSVCVPVVLLSLLAMTLRARALDLLDGRRCRRALAGLVFVDLLLFGSALNPTAGSSVFRPRAHARPNSYGRVALTESYVKAQWDDYINYARFRKPGARPDWRGPIEARVPSTNLVSREYQATGYDPVRLRSVDRRLAQLSGRHPHSWMFMGVTELLGGRLETWGMNLYPRGLLVSPMSFTGVRLVDHANRMECQLQATGTFYLSDNAYPGWRAYLDGGRVQLNGADGFRRVVVARPGRLRFVFESPALLIGGFVTMGSVVLLVAAVTARALSVPFASSACGAP